ncbi:hypothetical protein D3C77_582710 [compost metagenome]
MRDLGVELLFSEERFDRLLAQLDAQHPIPLFDQPGEIDALAAQRHQHLRTRRKPKPGPVAPQPGMHHAKVKTDFIARPALQPEVFAHPRTSFQ